MSERVRDYLRACHVYADCFRFPSVPRGKTDEAKVVAVNEECVVLHAGLSGEECREANQRAAAEGV